ncbi:MAG: DUF502 domain-containing protein [Myxococcota bacterium]|jgi:uncharacterized membrane protein|nr:DUF502 domain-containing protein [Myxococcota bacterium]
MLRRPDRDEAHVTPHSESEENAERGLLSRAWHATWTAIRRYFVAGLLAFAPIGITFWAIAWIVQRLDNLLLPQVVEWLFPGMDEPIQLPPVVGALFTFVVILLAGVVVRHFFGAELVRGWERMLLRVPVARSIYAGVKQLFEAVLAGSGRTTSFNTVVLIQYPRRGLWALAFTTGNTRGSLQDAFPEQQMVNCFVPTTPNPTSGFYLLVPEDDIREVDMSVEDAFKVIMSAGLVTPEQNGPPPEAG